MQVGLCGQQLCCLMGSDRAGKGEAGGEGDGGIGQCGQRLDITLEYSLPPTAHQYPAAAFATGGRGAGRVQMCPP